MKTIIFTQRVEVIESYNERRDCADQRIANFIWDCGFLPLAVPNIPQITEKIVSEIIPSGIILVGGNSLVKYGGNSPERDETDRMLINIAIKKNIPVYGFCRGMQSILDYFGNRLVKVPNHVGVRHVITGKDNASEVNSYHNEACVELDNDELIIIMKSQDGVIEKVQHKSLPIIGVMWHPEREKNFRIEDIETVRRLMNHE